MKEVVLIITAATTTYSIIRQDSEVPNHLTGPIWPSGRERLSYYVKSMMSTMFYFCPTPQMPYFLPFSFSLCVFLNWNDEMLTRWSNVVAFKASIGSWDSRKDVSPASQKTCINCNGWLLKICPKKNSNRFISLTNAELFTLSKKKLDILGHILIMAIQVT